MFKLVLVRLVAHHCSFSRTRFCYFFSFVRRDSFLVRKDYEYIYNFAMGIILQFFEKICLLLNHCIPPCIQCILSVNGCIATSRVNHSCPTLYCLMKFKIGTNCFHWICSLYDHAGTNATNSKMGKHFRQYVVDYRFHIIILSTRSSIYYLFRSWPSRPGMNRMIKGLTKPLPNKRSSMNWLRNLLTWY